MSKRRIRRVTRRKKSNFGKGVLVGVAAAVLLACSPPKAEPTPKYVVQDTQMANTPANQKACGDTGGTVLRDPQPPRPTTDPGPTIICRRYVPA